MEPKKLMMYFIDYIFKFFKKPPKETKGKAPEGICPVCWGFGEYDHKIREILEDKQIDVNNHKTSYIKSQKFLKEHIEGMKVKKNEVYECPTCGNSSKK